MSKVIRVGGFDQGRDTHWGVVLEYWETVPHRMNILFADAVVHDDIIPVIDNFSCSQNFIDNEPDRLSAYELVMASKGRLKLGDQRIFEGDIKPIKVLHGGVELPCYAINQNLYKDKLVAGFKDPIGFRVTPNTKIHRKFEKHLTSVKRDPDSLEWLRPADHDDDLFFAMMFALAATALMNDPMSIKGKLTADRISALTRRIN